MDYRSPAGQKARSITLCPKLFWQHHTDSSLSRPLISRMFLPAVFIVDQTKRKHQSEVSRYRAASLLLHQHESAHVHLQAADNKISVTNQSFLLIRFHHLRKVFKQYFSHPALNVNKLLTLGFLFCVRLNSDSVRCQRRCKDAFFFLETVRTSKMKTKLRWTLTSKSCFYTKQLKGRVLFLRVYIQSEVS